MRDRQDAEEGRESSFARMGRHGTRCRRNDRASRAGLAEDWLLHADGSIEESAAGEAREDRPREYRIDGTKGVEGVEDGHGECRKIAEEADEEG